MSKKKNDLYSVRDLQGALNNAVLISGSPSTGEIPEARKRRLREYAQASIEPVVEHIEEGLLSPQEAVHIHCCAALFTYIRHVQGGDKLPASKQVKELLTND